ncbi:50S ribosomal protein L13 [Patescibacteria group bacterium]|nr:50S ribosomal protein L13 [Patescibacteria group bacterium]
MIIVDGKDAVLGRIGSYVVKEALKGEDVVILNCDEIIITGNKKDIRENFDKRRRKIGSGQKGPKHPRRSDLIVKRAIRGMLPDHRSGRGKIAYKKIYCYTHTPLEFENAKKIFFGKDKKDKFVRVKSISKERYRN